MITAPVSADDLIGTSLPLYEKHQGLSGNLSSTGSDTLANLVTHWSEQFKQLNPSVNIQIQATGSASAPVALLEGTTNIGPMSRKMKNSERIAFEKRYGYPPTAVIVGLDALAIFVNKDNPLQGLDLKTVDAIFSITNKCGNYQKIRNWGALGLTGYWANLPIESYGRNAASGTYNFFKQHALCNGDFKSRVNELLGSSSVIQTVSRSVKSIGYSSIGYATSGVRAIPLSTRPGQPFIYPTIKNIITDRYPLTRFLYVYVNKQPEKPLPLIETEFLHFILSKQGQSIVHKTGYVPLSLEAIKAQLQKVK